MSNAIESIPSGCGIRLEASDMGEYVEIHVTDDGPGIDPAILPRVLSPCFSMGDIPCKRIGSGLGLSICKMIVELHHGIIGIESQPGQGTDICIILPKERPRDDRQQG